MVVRPMANLTRGRSGPVQPGLKVRGRRTCGSSTARTTPIPSTSTGCAPVGSGRKQSLALREYVLGPEALERGAAGEPLWRVHEAVFAVLALESEPVDPRL